MPPDPNHGAGVDDPAASATSPDEMFRFNAMLKRALHVPTSKEEDAAIEEVCRIQGWKK